MKKWNAYQIKQTNSIHSEEENIDTLSDKDTVTTSHQI